jgi:hypothetical protein
MPKTIYLLAYQNIILGVFLKETTYGWDHKATLLVTEDANHQQVLQWTTGKKTTQIDIKAIVNTKYSSLNGKFLNFVFLLTFFEGCAHVTLGIFF